jgi:hypothetical protein
MESLCKDSWPEELIRSHSLPAPLRYCSVRFQSKKCLLQMSLSHPPLQRPRLRSFGLVLHLRLLRVPFGLHHY